VSEPEVHPRVAAVIAAGRERGIEVRPRTFGRDTRTAQEAAREVGCDVGQIAKSLVFEASGRPVLLIVSGSNRVDLVKAARALGAEEVRRADPGRAKEASGFSIGATPPFGHRTKLEVLMDEDLLDHEVVWAAGGRPDTVFPIAPDLLAKAAGASVCSLKEDL
jgi:Cys-tRNA(Pro) deacylase